MKKHIKFLFETSLPALILMLLIVSACSKKNEGYKITGNIKGLGNKSMFLFEWTGKKDTIVKMISENDNFILTGNINMPVQAYIEIVAVSGYIPVFIENSEIQVIGNVNDLKKVIITGSETDKIYKDFTKGFSEKFAKEKDSLSVIYNEAEKTNNNELLEQAREGYGKLYTKQKEFIIDFSKQHLNSVAVPYIMLEELFFRASIEELKELYNQFDPSILSSKYSKTVIEKITNLDRVAIGKPAPDFTMKDSAGADISLSSFKGKWVLIDFWSSNCGPCRKENPELAKLYRKYNEKGFEILGISSDIKRDLWINAIKTDGITWPQVCSLDRSNDPARVLYCWEYNPYNILVNPEGTIIAKEIGISDLEVKLKNVLK